MEKWEEVRRRARARRQPALSPASPAAAPPAPDTLLCRPARSPHHPTLFPACLPCLPEQGYYITAMAGSANGSSLVVMSKGTPYTQQSYKVSGEWPVGRNGAGRKWPVGWHGAQGISRVRGSAALHSPAPAGALALPRLRPSSCLPADSFPFKWINKKWKEGFFVTAMSTSHSRWAVVMSRNAGFVDQARGRRRAGMCHRVQQSRLLIAAAIVRPPASPVQP